MRKNTKGNSTNRIRGENGVIIDSEYYLELPKAPSKITPEVKRDGMIRYNKEWKSFEGALEFEDGTISYRRFANLDENGRLLTSQLPDSIVSGLKYIGTFAPITDDVDPPYDSVDPLPVSEPDNYGQYYIVRGITDAAYKHLEANNPATSPVVFTIGTWTEIKYYFIVDRLDKSRKIVMNAFARILKDKVPSTGHAGFVSLIKDEELTNPFSPSKESIVETQFMDGDWVTSTGVWQRLRNTRISILASAVQYDRSAMYTMNRPVEDAKTGSVQEIIDASLMFSFRRSGDSMMNNGTRGSGRLGIIYGSASEPSIAFNNLPFDPIKNPGHDPSKWSDTSTGIFHPADNSVGFSARAREKLRITPTNIIFYQHDVSPTTNPSIQLAHSSNTNNIGITAINDILYVSVKNKSELEVGVDLTTVRGNAIVDKNLTVTQNIYGKADQTIDGNTLIKKNLTVQGNTTFGSSCSNTLTVNANSTFNCDVKLNSNVDIGSTCDSGKVLNVNSVSTFTCDVNMTKNVNIGTDENNKLLVKSDSFFNSYVNIDKKLTVLGNTTFGSSCSNTFIVNSNSTFNCDSTFDKNLTIKGNLTANGNINLGDPAKPCETTITLNGKTDITCDATIAKTLTVQGNTTLKGNLDVSLNAKVNGDTTLSKNLTVLGNFTANNTAGTTNIQHKTITLGNSTDSSVKVLANTEINQNLTVLGNTRLNNKVYFGNSEDVFMLGDKSQGVTTSDILRFNAKVVKFTHNTNTNSDVKINEFGIKLPFYSDMDNTKGDEGSIVYNNSRKRIMFKDHEKWNDIGNTTYRSVDINVADWKTGTSGLYVDLPNPDNFKVLSVQLYADMGGALRLVTSNYTVLLKNKVRVFITEGLAFKGTIRAVVSDDKETLTLPDDFQ